MRDGPGQNARWALTGSALDAMLSRLDADRERAAVQYESLRARLQALLRWWGSIDPIELADKTLDRVAAKLEEGVVVPLESLPAYLRSTARLVYYEALREADREERARREAPQAGGADPHAEEALRALDECLDTLSAPDRDLILGYYANDGGSNIAARRRLGTQRNLSSTALRIRAHRLRERLERCVGGAAPATG